MTTVTGLQTRACMKRIALVGICLSIAALVAVVRTVLDVEELATDAASHMAIFFFFKCHER